MQLCSQHHLPIEKIIQLRPPQLVNVLVPLYEIHNVAFSTNHYGNTLLIILRLKMNVLCMHITTSACSCEFSCISSEMPLIP